MSTTHKGVANLRPWPKGVSGNPNGGSRLPKDLLKLRQIARSEVVRVISKCMVMTRDQLKTMSLSKDATIAEILIASIITHAIKNGCPIRTQFLLQYVVGKPKPVEFEDEGETVEPDAVDMLPSEIIIDVLRKHAAAVPGNDPT